MILHSILIHAFTVTRCRGRGLHLLRNITASISFVLQPSLVPMLLLSPLLHLLIAYGSSIAVLVTPLFLPFVTFFLVYFVVNLLTVLYVTLAVVQNIIVQLILSLSLSFHFPFLYHSYRYLGTRSRPQHIRCPLVSYFH